MSLKRAVDLVVAVPLFILSLPLLALISVVVWATMGRPVLFSQERPGLHGRTFRLLKFRTMRPAGAGDTFATSRVTVLGAWLRSTSLDELPELLNVIKGDMALVGPRPLLTEYIPLYNDEQVCRHDVKPGITGLAQVKGRNRLSWRRKFKYDVWYARHHSLCLDMKILYLTIMAVFRTEDVNQSSSDTMEPFRGNNC